MTIVSDGDPSLWPIISYFRGYSYFTGSSDDVNYSIFDDCGFSVVATTALIYDCGKQDYTYRGNTDVTRPNQRWHLGKRWVDSVTCADISLTIVFIGRTDLGEQNLVSENGTMIHQFCVGETLVRHDHFISQRTWFVVSALIGCADFEIYRCAILEYHTLCTFASNDLVWC